ncbi:MAG: trehalose-phosphatase [Candidatus Nezhaarchaeota archaeon]|nr:trehalose-phosphatase [Candidatus Nezhaarchaeota archaeon]
MVVLPSYLYGRWPEVEGRLRLSLGVLLTLDYEGTLTDRPEEAELDHEVKSSLESLAKDVRWARVVVIDRRTVDQLKKLIGVGGVFYAGLDGMVITGPGLSLVHELAHKLRDRVVRLRDELEEALQGFSGVVLKDKGLSIAISYAQAPRGLGRRVARIVTSVLSERGNFKPLRGRRVVEIVPNVDWDRGRAVDLLLEREELREYLPVYVGNDESDEPAFRALGARGLTVVVGRRPRSYAKFYVRNVGEVYELLKRIAKLSSPLG